MYTNSIIHLTKYIIQLLTILTKKITPVVYQLRNI